MSDLIPINYDDNQVTVSARDLHEFLEIKTDFRKWFPRMTEYGFQEPEDYTPVIFVHPQNLQETTDYLLTIDTAKHIAMIQRNEKGRLAREYFIQIEKSWNDPKMIFARALQLAGSEIEQLKLQRQQDQPKIDFYNDIMDCKNAVEMKDAAKELNIPGFGRTKLFQFLRDEKILMHDNTPYQRYIDSGCFRVHVGSFNHPYGEKRQYTKTLVFPKGLQMIRRRIENARKR
jgi:anti-repressor protein